MVYLYRICQVHLTPGVSSAGRNNSIVENRRNNLCQLNNSIMVKRLIPEDIDHGITKIKGLNCSSDQEQSESNQEQSESDQEESDPLSLMLGDIDEFMVQNEITNICCQRD